MRLNSHGEALTIESTDRASEEIPDGGLDHTLSRPSQRLIAYSYGWVVILCIFAANAVSAIVSSWS